MLRAICLRLPLTLVHCTHYIWLIWSAPTSPEIMIRQHFSVRGIAPDLSNHSIAVISSHLPIIKTCCICTVGTNWFLLFQWLVTPPWYCADFKTTHKIDKTWIRPITEEHLKVLFDSERSNTISAAKSSSRYLIMAGSRQLVVGSSWYHNTTDQPARIACNCSRIPVVLCLNDYFFFSLLLKSLLVLVGTQSHVVAITLPITRWSH